MFCGKCGNELKPGAKFCPQCGSAVTPVREQPVQVQDSENMGFVSAPVQETTAEFGGGTATAVMTKPKQKLSWGKKVIIGVAVVLVLIIVIAAIGNGGSEKYADDLVKASNAFGLSTSMTLEEFVAYYNEFLIKSLDIETDLEFSTQCIDMDDPYSVTPYDDLSITEYCFVPLGSLQTKLQQHIRIAIDDKTGYVVMAVLRYMSDGYRSTTTTDSARNAVDTKAGAIFFGLSGGDAEKGLTMLTELNNATPNSWDEGIVYVSSLANDGLVTRGFYTMTKEYYETWSGNIS